MFALPPSPPPPQFPLPIDPGGTELPIIHVGWNLPVIYYYYYYFRRDGTQGGSGGREGRGGGGGGFPNLFVAKVMKFPDTISFLLSSLPWRRKTGSSYPPGASYPRITYPIYHALPQHTINSTEKELFNHIGSSQLDG